MLIINKKYSNLLKGYQRAIELDEQLKTDWELIYKPEINKVVNENFVNETKKYEEKLKIWQEMENRKIAEWQSNETARKIEFELVNKVKVDQICFQNKQQSLERTNWMIAWIVSFIVFFWLLIIPGKSHLPIVIFGILSISYLLFSFSITALIVFIVKSNGKTQPIPRFIPTPKPQVDNWNNPDRPIEPQKVDSILQNFECPSVLNRWIEEIQYKDGGDEFFRNFAKKCPQAIAGIPGEISMMKSINSIFDQNQRIINENGIYILGLRIGNKDDIDGIEIDKRGIWILESKYYDGELSYQYGQWKHNVYVKHATHDFLKGWQEKTYDHPLELDNQWLREFNCVLNILSKELKTYPWLEKLITGGLVFTHPDVIVDINNCPVQYSIGMDQAILMQRESEKPELTFAMRLEIADTLLEANRKFEPEDISSVHLAQEISDKLRTYLKEQAKNKIN